MKHDAMKVVRKIECTTMSITSRWVLTWTMIDGNMDGKARLVIKCFMDPQVNQMIPERGPETA